MIIFIELPVVGGSNDGIHSKIIFNLNYIIRIEMKSSTHTRLLVTDGYYYIPLPYETVKSLIYEAGGKIKS